MRCSGSIEPPQMVKFLANPALCKMLGCASLQELQQRNLEKDGFHPAYLRSSFKREIEKRGVIIGLEASWTILTAEQCLFVKAHVRSVMAAETCCTTREQ